MDPKGCGKWYISNVSIIFDCSMLLYYPYCCFFAYFSVLKKRNITRSPNRMKPSGSIFLEQTWSRGLGVDVKQSTRRPRGRGRTYPPRRALHPHGPLVAPPTYFFLLYIYSYTPKTSGSTMKPYFHRRNLLYPRDLILGPFPELRRRGNGSRRASTSNPWPLWCCVSSLLQTFRSIVIR